MDSQYKLLSELLSDQAAFITSPKTNLVNYWEGHCPPAPQCLRAWKRLLSFVPHCPKSRWKQHFLLHFCINRIFSSIMCRLFMNMEDSALSMLTLTRL